MHAKEKLASQKLMSSRTWSLLSKGPHISTSMLMVCICWSLSSKNHAGCIADASCQRPSSAGLAAGSLKAEDPGTQKLWRDFALHCSSAGFIVTPPASKFWRLLPSHCAAAEIQRPLGRSDMVKNIKKHQKRPCRPCSSTVACDNHVICPDMFFDSLCCSSLFLSAFLVWSTRNAGRPFSSNGVLVLRAAACLHFAGIRFA